MPGTRHGGRAAISARLGPTPTPQQGGTRRCVFLGRDARLALADYLEYERPHNRAELERRLGHANDRYLRLYTNLPEDVAASWAENL